MSAEPVARIRIHLTAKALDALNELHTQSGASKTDLLNRSIQAFALIEAERRAGGQILVRRPDGTQYVAEFL